MCYSVRVPVLRPSTGSLLYSIHAPWRENNWPVKWKHIFPCVPLPVPNNKTFPPPMAPSTLLDILKLEEVTGDWNQNVSRAQLVHSDLDLWIRTLRRLFWVNSITSLSPCPPILFGIQTEWQKSKWRKFICLFFQNGESFFSINVMKKAWLKIMTFYYQLIMELWRMSNGIIISARCMDVCVCVCVW